MTSAIACHHCGEAIDRPGRWRTTIDGIEREMCCAGCRAVAEAIAAAGLADYYRTRSQPAAVGALPEAIERLRVWDDADVQARFVRRADVAPDEHSTPGQPEPQEATLLVDGLRCGACVWLLEQTLRREPGVVGVSVNLATERATVRWNPAITRLSRVLGAAARVGYAARPFDARGRQAQIQRTTKALFRRLFVAALAMMQVMMYAFPAYVAAPGEIEPGHESLMRWASLLLTLPVLLYSATPFFAGAWRDLRARSPGMDVPVAIGVLAAFAASAHATIVGRGEVYFDSVTMFVCLLLAARYVEWIARRRAGRAIDAIAAAAPDSADRIDPVSGAIERVPATRLAPGDHFRVAVGERIAVDSRIVDGRTAIDASLLTGESVPVARARGDEVPGGAVNAGSPFVAQALRASADSAISTIERLIDRAAADKPRLAGITERVARIFVTALLLLSAGVWLVWMQLDPSRAAPIAIAVLVVSCPCALSMATPAALAAATGAAIRRGLLVGRGDAFERIAECTDIVFDKTGTLTQGRPEVVRVVVLDGAEGAEGAATQHPLELAAALEAGQSHPFAAAIVRTADTERSGAKRIDCDEPASTTAGLGVEGRIGGRRYRLGALGFVAPWHPLLATLEDDRCETHVWLVDEERPLARIELHDRLREEARGVIDTLAGRGLRVHLLSGDREARVRAVAGELRIDDSAANAGPAVKLDYVRALQRQGRRVAMIGDGINDAPVLAAADVSVAVGEATSLARTAASVVLLGGSLRELVWLHDLALRTRRVVRQNLAWALAYNAVAIPAAALGWVPPWLAALGMTTSSLLVVFNALRLIPAARGRARSQTMATNVTVSPAAARA